jgi:hypothetical protein
MSVDEGKKKDLAKGKKSGQRGENVTHSRLVCQRAVVLPIRTRVHSPVSLSPRTASPFMLHSYALYPDDSRVIVTHPLCSLYAIGPCLPVTCDVTRSVPSIYIQGP